MKICQNRKATKNQKKRTIQETTQNLMTAHASQLQTKSDWKHLAPVIQTLDSAIHRINHYPADSVIDFRNTHPLDSGLSGV